MRTLISLLPIRIEEAGMWRQRTLDSEPGDWGNIPARTLSVCATQHLASYFVFLHQYVGDNSILILGLLRILKEVLMELKLQGFSLA